MTTRLIGQPKPAEIGFPADGSCLDLSVATRFSALIGPARARGVAKNFHCRPQDHLASGAMPPNDPRRARIARRMEVLAREQSEKRSREDGERFPSRAAPLSLEGARPSSCRFARA